MPSLSGWRWQTSQFLHPKACRTLHSSTLRRSARFFRPSRSLKPLPHAACLPRCPHGRGLLAAATTPDCLGRPLLRCPHLRCLVADGASSAAHHQTMYTCPAARPCPPGGRDCAALARDPLPRKACAAICTETVQGTPWHRSRYPKQTVASNFQGTPNLYVDGTSCFLLDYTDRMQNLSLFRTVLKC